MRDASPASLCPDTSGGSLLHWLALRRGPITARTLAAAYLLSAAIVYLPLLLAAWFGRVPFWGASDAKTLPFLNDWGLCFALLVSFPTLVLLLITDEALLVTSVEQVQADGVFAIGDDAAEAVNIDWGKRFRRWNIRGELFAIGLGIALGVLTYLPQRWNPGASWIAPKAGQNVAGYAYLYSITLLYVLVTFYIIRCITVSRFLADLVRRAPLQILPLHPDKCGGLRPVGRLGLRNQYTLTVLGLNIVLLLLVWRLRPEGNAGVSTVMIGATIAYLIFGPVVFMAPLLPFRDGMTQAKSRWMREVAQLVRRELERLHANIQTGQVTRADEESLERLQKIGAVIDELPVWPFDARTLRRFATAYLVPVIASLAGTLVTDLGQRLFTFHH
ncbi:MAG: hypothetical protein M3081_17310 [Gemmatimonadota bacterium]|nr:hypothetical protein [Gemmatimonadota bacterium]